MALRYYMLEIGGETVRAIDVENMTRIIDGTDQLAARRWDCKHAGRQGPDPSREESTESVTEEP